MYTLEQERYRVTTEPITNDGFIDHMYQGDKDAKYKMIWSRAFLNRLRIDLKQLQGLEQQKIGRRKCLLVVVHPGRPDGKRVIELAGFDENEAHKNQLEGVRSRLGTRNPIDSNNNLNKSLFPGSNPSFDYEYRDETLNDLYRIFIGANESESNGLTKPQALIGPAKMGKTEIAVKYAYQNRNHYLYVFWIDASDRKSLVEGFKHIANVVKSTSSNVQQIFDPNGQLLVSERQLIDTVKRWLEDTRHVLLILDRCDNLNEHEIGDFLPRQARSHILLTTCSPLTRSVAESIEINGLTPTNSANLLLKQAGVKKTVGAIVTYH